MIRDTLGREMGIQMRFRHLSQRKGTRLTVCLFVLIACTNSEITVKVHMEELQEETHATCADARQNAGISGIEAGEGAGGSSPHLPERPCCREVMLREDLRLSLPE